MYLMVQLRRYARMNACYHYLNRIEGFFNCIINPLEKGLLLVVHIIDDGYYEACKPITLLSFVYIH